jgi:hypothetical protein
MMTRTGQAEQEMAGGSPLPENCAWGSSVMQRKLQPLFFLKKPDLETDDPKKQ